MKKRIFALLCALAMIMPALCGDLWDAPERFKTDHLLIWPVYVNYTPEEWENGALDEYAEQALLVSGDTLMINPIDRNPVNHGGSFRFRDGTVTERIPYDEEQILIVPGRNFGCTGWVRIAYCVAYETIQNALPGFERLAKQYGL